MLVNNVAMRKLKTICEKEPNLTAEDLGQRVKADVRALTNKSFGVLKTGNGVYSLNQR
jgi:hypothetical protein